MQINLHLNDIYEKIINIRPALILKLENPLFTLTEI